MDVSKLNRQHVKQAMYDTILANGMCVTISEYPTKDNGFGKMIPDYDETPVEVTYGPARVVKHTHLPFEMTQGLGTSDSWYILACADADWLKEEMIFTYQGQVFETEPPEPRVGFGGVLYRIARLKDRTKVGYPGGKP